MESVDGVVEHVDFQIGATAYPGADHVRSFDVSPRITTATQAHLGTSDVDDQQDHQGWQGSCELTLKTDLAELLINAAVGAIRSQLPGAITMSHYWVYPSTGVQEGHVYPAIKLTDARKTSRRGDVTTVSLSWQIGTDRLPLLG